MNECNDPDHGAINAERAESRGLRKAWVELDDKRQSLERELTAMTKQRDGMAELLSDIYNYAKGKKPHDYSKLTESDRIIAAFDAWQEIECKIEELLQTTPTQPETK
jgi:hypothetical protein